jgi:hypothetical protein
LSVLELREKKWTFVKIEKENIFFPFERGRCRTLLGHWIPDRQFLSPSMVGLLGLRPNYQNKKKRKNYPRLVASARLSPMLLLCYTFRLFF